MLLNPALCLLYCDHSSGLFVECGVLLIFVSVGYHNTLFAANSFLLKTHRHCFSVIEKVADYENGALVCAKQLSQVVSLHGWMSSVGIATPLRCADLHLKAKPQTTFRLRE